jgi:hypothetical protein
MESIFSEDYDLVVPSGEVMNKQQLIEIYRSGDMQQEALNVEDLQLRVYGDVAVARGLYRRHIPVQRAKIEQAFLRTDVLVKSERSGGLSQAKRRNPHKIWRSRRLAESLVGFSETIAPYVPFGRRAHI